MQEFSSLPVAGKLRLPDLPPKDLGMVFIHRHGTEVDLLRPLLRLNPAQRPTAADVVRNLYFYEHPLPSNDFQIAKLLRYSKTIAQ